MGLEVAVVNAAYYPCDWQHIVDWSGNVACFAGVVAFEVLIGFERYAADAATVVAVADYNDDALAGADVFETVDIAVLVDIDELIEEVAVSDVIGLD